MKNIFSQLLYLVYFSLFFTSNSYGLDNHKFLQIEKLISDQNIEKAFDEIKKVEAGKEKLSPQAYLLMGQIYLELDKPFKANSYFEKVKFSSTNLDAEANAGLSRGNLMLGNIFEARNFSENALRINPDLLEGKIAYALSHEDVLSAKKIDEIFLSAIRSDRGNTLAAREYIQYLIRQNRLNSAEKIIKETLIKNETSGPILALYSDILWIRGEVEKSVRYRTDAEASFRLAGNQIKANEMLAWLNIEALPKIEKLEAEQVKTQLEDTNKKKGNGKPVQEKEPGDIVISANKKIFQPLANPEKIPVDGQKGFITGSGTIINNGKAILTNKHVVEKVNYIAVRNGLGETRIATAVIESDTDDLAIIELDKPYPNEYAFNMGEFEKHLTGEDIFVMGYPMAFTLGTFHPTITKGIVSNELGFGETRGEFQITAKVHPGNSGGPIFNKFGRIVGVATGGLDKTDILEKDGFIPDGINYAVSSDRIKSFLSEPMPVGNQTNFQYDASNLYQYMRASVVIVVGQE